MGLLLIEEIISEGGVIGSGGDCEGGQYRAAVVMGECVMTGTLHMTTLRCILINYLVTRDQEYDVHI